MRTLVSGFPDHGDFSYVLASLTLPKWDRRDDRVFRNFLNATVLEPDFRVGKTQNFMGSVGPGVLQWTPMQETQV